MSEITINNKSRIISGRCKIDKLAGLIRPGCKRAVVVKDPLIPESAASGIASMLLKKGIDCVFYTDIKGRISSKDAEALSDFIKKGFIQCVIGFGGCKIINTARLAVSSAESGRGIDDILDSGYVQINDKTRIEYLEIPSSIRNPLMFTSLAASADSRSREVKIIDTGMAPSVIIRDPSLYESLPRSRKDSIYFELLLNAAEQLLLRERHFFTDSLLSAVFAKLFKSRGELSIDELSDAALCCDYASSISGPGIGYYISLVLNNLTGVPGSFLSAILLPHLLDNYFSSLPDSADEIIRYAGMENSAADFGSEDFTAEIRKLIKIKNLPIRLSETGIRKEILQPASLLSSEYPDYVKPGISMTAEKISALLKSAF